MKIIYLFSSIILLSSCSVNNNVDLKKYFWNISDYETPKVLVYSHDSVGTISTVYHLIKKISDNELSLTMLDKNFNETQYLTDLFKPDGVYLTDASFVEDIKTKLVTKSNIISGFIYSYTDFKRKMSIETSFDLQLKNDINIINKDSWVFEDIKDKNINGKEINTIVSKGLTERTFTKKSTGEKHTLQINFENWYSKGIGITKTKQETPVGIITDTYVKTITIDEFNKMKNK
jgi:hypothetical protein